jgi:hypothetical protein
MGRNRISQVFAKIPQADTDMEMYFLLRYMVKAGEAESSYTARSGRPAAWLKQDKGEALPYSFSTVMEIRAIKGPESREEEARRIEDTKDDRRKKALSREAVGSRLKEAIREMGLMEDIVRDEAMEKGIIRGGGIRKSDKADVSIFRGIKIDSVPAWANYGRGRGVRGIRGGTNPNRGGHDGARGGQGLRGARGGRGRCRGGGEGDRGRGGRGARGARGGQGSWGARGGGRGRGGRNDSSDLLSGGNVEAITDKTPDRKRKMVEDDSSEESKKVNFMELAAPSPSDPPPSASAPAPSLSKPAPSSSAASGRVKKKKDGGKSLLGMLLSRDQVDVGKGFRLFD